jgi:spore maturation protein CgeB
MLMTSLRMPRHVAFPLPEVERPMKLVIFGLAVSSSWGNGHAVLWRALIRAFAERGHRIVFFERDVPYYAQNRDLTSLEGGRLVLYGDWGEVLPEAKRELSDADAGMITSYCPDALAATDLILGAPCLRVFYDLDTPVTLAQLAAGRRVGYIGPNGLEPFDLVLSYTGGEALAALRHWLGAKRVAPLYGSVDPRSYQPVAAPEPLRADLSYLGTYADDRQDALKAFFIEPARHRPMARFIIGGAQYPNDFPWKENIFFFRHVPSLDHPRFYASARLTLNVTRQAMASCGWCPSGRLFEAGACAAPIISDWWDGLDQFFRPDREILIARTTEDVLAALDRSDADLAAIGTAARERTLAWHTAGHRAAELETLLLQRAE